MFNHLVRNRKKLYERTLYKMLYVLVKNGKQDVAEEISRNNLSKVVSSNNFAICSYPNSLYFFYLYYGAGFFSKSKT